MRSRTCSGLASMTAITVCALGGAAWPDRVFAADTTLQWQVTTLSCGQNQAQHSLAITNTGTTAVSLSSISVKFWIDDFTGRTLVPHVWTGGCVTGVGGNPSCSHQVSGATAVATKFTPTCGPDPAHQANWEIAVSDSDGSTLPPGATWSGLQVAINLADYSNFVPGSRFWYSACIPGNAPAASPRYAVYLNGTAQSDAQPPSCRRPQGAQVLQGPYVPTAVATASFVGPLSRTVQVQLSVGLPLRNPQDLQQKLQQISDPQSPLYRQYMTPSAFAASYGPTSSDYQNLTSFATSNGLSVVKTYGNNQLLDVKGTVASIQKAFNVFLNVYRRPDGSTFYAPDTNPSVTLASQNTRILQVHGLDNFRRPPKAGGSGIFDPNLNANLYLGRDFRNAYAPGVTLTGVGQTLAIVAFDGFKQSDITAYENSVSPPLRDVPVHPVLIDGFDGQPHRDQIEVALDIMMGVAMAPGLDAIYVYEGPFSLATPGVAYDVAADDVLHTIATATNADGKPLSNQISSSYYGFGGENVAAAIKQFAAQGQSFFMASGDFGAFGDSNPVPLPFTEDEISWVTVVGGTELFTQPGGGARISERVWNDAVNHPNLPAWASSGGVLTGVFIPFYQAGVAAQIELAGGNATWRNVPDVSMVATGIQEYLSGNTIDFTGTSASAPLWAAFMALVNEQAASNGRPPVGFANPAIYAIGQGPNYSRDFNDITTGTNNLSGSGLYQARSGYDLTTGWGTPTGMSLIDDLAGLGSPCVNKGNGSVCGTDQICVDGHCVACTAGITCTPDNPCHSGTTSCATLPTCTDTLQNVPDGPTGVACIPANPCHVGAGQCAAGELTCQDTGFLAPDGTACGSNLVCVVGQCGLGTGSPCTSDNDCASRACRNYTGSPLPSALICLGLANTPCTHWYECTTVSCTTQTVCDQGSVPSQCWRDSDCVTNRCSGNGQQGNCLPSSPGGACAWHGDCTTDSCGDQTAGQCDNADAGQECSNDMDCTGTLCALCGGCGCNKSGTEGICTVLNPGTCP